MEQKDMYTLEELYGELGIPLTELSKRTGVSDVTLAKIRDGQSARRSTVNSILHAFSEIYNIKLSTENVRGIIIRDKLARRQEQERIAESVTASSVQTPAMDNTRQEENAQNLTTMTKKGISSSTSAKKSKDSTLPEGAMLTTDFARSHNVKRETFRDHMLTGLGKGLIHGEGVPEDGSVQVKDYVRSEERNKRVRTDGTIEKERYLTQEQQQAALLFWQRHHVSFTQCENTSCWCHTFLEEEE